MSSKNKIAIPCVVCTHKSGEVEVDIPDLSMSIKASSITEAIAESILNVTAIYVYRKDHNMPIEVVHTYEELAKSSIKMKDPHFVHMLTLNGEG